MKLKYYIYYSIMCFVVMNFTSCISNKNRTNPKEVAIDKISVIDKPKIIEESRVVVEPKEIPKVINNEPKLEPIVEPAVTPKVEPKVEPKGSPKVEPKVEPVLSTMPVIVPKSTPSIEPKSIQKPIEGNKNRFEPKKGGKPIGYELEEEIVGKNDNKIENNFSEGKTSGQMVQAAIEEVSQNVKLCYSYFTKMTVGESKDINVTVSLNKTQIALAEEIKKKVEEQEGKILEEIKNDSQFCLTVPAYKFLIVKLIDLEKSFIITSEDSAKQSVENSSWRWTIEPKSDAKSKTARLLLKTIAVKEDGSTEKLKERDIRIDIQINTNFLFRIGNYLSDNPAYLLSALIIPFITYLSKLKRKKKEENLA